MTFRWFVSSAAHWIDNHWGDLIGLLVMYSGVFMVIKGWAPDTGTALILAGMGVLKLRNPNGKTQPQ